MLPRGEGGGEATPSGNEQACSMKITKMTPKRYLSYTKVSVIIFKG